MASASNGAAVPAGAIGSLWLVLAWASRENGGMIFRSAVLLIALFQLLPMRAQTGIGTNRPAFEVASVKLKTDCETNSSTIPSRPGYIYMTCIPVRNVISMAYALSAEGGPRRVELLNGPRWIESDRYEIIAKTEDKSASPATLGLMLRALLEDRFKLKVHMEPRETAVFDLTVSGKQGRNLHYAKEADCAPKDWFRELTTTVAPRNEKECGVSYGSMEHGIVSYDVYGINMSEFAGPWLTAQAGRVVVDKTNLSGRFDIHLEFVPEKPRGQGLINGGQPFEIPPEDPIAGPSIFAAMQKQLGLKLSPSKARLNAVVIDHIERPSEN